MVLCDTKFLKLFLILSHAYYFFSLWPKGGKKIQPGLNGGPLNGRVDLT